jgi:maleamate amidohydrolase
MNLRNAPDARTAAQYEAAGFTGGFTLGTRPALVIVDFSLGFTSPESPLGSDMSEVLGQTEKLLASARQRHVFTVFTTIAFDAGSFDSVAWIRKVPSLSLLTCESRWVEIDPVLRRLDSEPVIAKTGASAFSGTMKVS